MLYEVITESLPEHRRGFSKPELKRRYRVLVTDPAFVGVAIVGRNNFV